MTAYLKVPFAYPLLIARNACRNARPSLPCDMANAHSAGEDTRDHDISLSNELASLKEEGKRKRKKKKRQLLTKSSPPPY